jgi:hypothetical protein
MNLLDLSPNSSGSGVVNLLGSHATFDLEPQRAAPQFGLANSATIVGNADSFLHFYLSENGDATLMNVNVAAESSNTNIIPTENVLVTPEHSTDWVMELTPAGTQLGTTLITLSATNDAGLGTVASILVSVFMPLGIDGSLLGTSNILWQTSGDEPWFGQGNVLFEGKPTAQSGRIGSGGQSILEAEVTGPGILSFWWKVSSEADWDWLQLESAQETNMISGEVDWQFQQIAIAPGLQTVTWRYTKDPDCCGIGLDSGWIAGVKFVGGSWLDAVTSSGNGVTSFVVHGLPGHTYQLQYSVNLVQWFPIANILATNVAMPSQAPTSTDPARFYRLLDVTK